MLHTVVPRRVLGVQFRLKEKQVGEKVNEGQDHQKCIHEPLMSLNGTGTKFVFDWNSAGLSDMHHVVHYLKQLAQVHLVIPGVVECLRYCTERQWDLFFEGRVVCYVSFHLRDHGTRLHVYVYCVERLRDAAEKRIYDIMGGRVWLPSKVDFSSK